MRYEVLTGAKKGINLPKIISLDTEYSELDVKNATLLSISIGVSPDLTYILEDFQSANYFISNADVIFTWNGVVDRISLSSVGVNLPKEKVIDAMLMEHLIDERLDHGLGDYAKREQDDDYKNLFWAQYDRYQDAPKEVAYEYEMKDGCYTYAAGTKYLEILKDKMDLVKHVHRLYWALSDTEYKGIRVNTALMRLTKQTMSETISKQLEQLRKEHHEYCQLWELQKWRIELGKRKSDKGKLGVQRPTFSFASNPQLTWLLYDAMECPVLEKTKTGNPSTSFKTISRLSEEVPGLGTVVEYVDTKGVYATFVEGMLEKVVSDRIYPHFNINGTRTGRISHSDPNMANLPSEGVIRNFFLPDPGCRLVGADYSQLEVAIEANLTEDKSLLKILLEGVSKHDITADGLGISRDKAKTLNFALQYGAGAFKVSQILGISRAEGEDVLRRYWDIYSGVRHLKELTCKTLAETGRVTNLFGRSRHFDKPKNEYEKAKFERMAYSHMVQGVGADMCNMATYLIAEEFKAKEYGRLLFSVHDEILTEVKENLIEEAKAAIVKQMGVPNEKLNLKYPVSCKLYGPLSMWSKA